MGLEIKVKIFVFAYIERSDKILSHNAEILLEFGQ
jgi:hypothetical protein